MKWGEILFEVAYTFSQLQFQNKFLLLLYTQTFHHEMFHPIVMAFDIEIRLVQATQGIDLLTYVFMYITYMLTFELKKCILCTSGFYWTVDFFHVFQINVCSLVI